MSSRMLIGLSIKGKIYGATDPMSQMLGTSLRVLSTVQLTRFAVMDIQQLMTGEGGLGDALSLMTNLILLTFRYNQLLDMSIVKQATLNALRFGAATPLALAGVLGLGAVGLLAAPAVVPSIIDSRREREPMYQELAWRAMSG